MATYTRHRVDTEDERKMLIGLIVSDRICREVLPLLMDDDYYQTAYTSIVAGWVRKYYEKYGKAPGRHIQDIFEVEKKNIHGDRVGLVEGFLGKLSEEYELETSLNEPYLIDRTVEYLEERSLLILAKRIESNVIVGEKGKARALVADYKKVAKLMSTWSNPFDATEVNQTMDGDTDVMFQMPGALGRLLGPFERGDFIAVMAPTKRGKTWFMMEIAVIALLNKLRVAFVSLEMRKKKMQQRLYRRIVSGVDVHGGRALYPVFDCLNNQDGSCARSQRKGSGDLLDGDDIRCYDEKVLWIPCDECRGTKDFVVSDVHWYIPLERPPFDTATIRESVKSLWVGFGGNNLRLKCYPRFSANLGDVMRDLDILEYADGFVPDVVIIDDADSAKPEKSYAERTEEIDQTWMAMGRLGDERKCLVVASTQGNRESWDARSTKAKHVSGYYMKFAHVDTAFMLSQTPQEKSRNLIRCSVAVTRNEFYNENIQVKILQKLDAGQPLLDSEFEIF